MQKRVLFIADAYEGCVEVGCEFAYFAEKKIADHECAFIFLLVKFKQAPVFQQGNLGLLIFM